MTASALVVSDAAAWRMWLDDHEDHEPGVWLRLAKKGTTTPTSLRYSEALREALCSGWIDGQRRGVDDATFEQRFTPRRARSVWSRRNVELVERLEAEGRMRPRGLAEMAAARADGRWGNAYAGQADAEIPVELAVALADDPAAASVFAGLTRSERYGFLHPVISASAGARSARAARAVERLRRMARDDV